MRCVRALPVHGSTAASRCAWQKPARNVSVTVSNTRLEEFMRAEQNYFAQKQMTVFTAPEIVSVTTPLGVAKLVHKELPRHFADRLKHMESLKNWEECEDLARLHEVFSASFKALRLVEPSGSNIAEYSEVISTLRTRHKAVMPLLGQSIQRLYKEGFFQNERHLNAWVDKFMTSRIATEMLTSHFLAITEAPTSCSDYSDLQQKGSWWGPVDVPESPTGIVDTDCDPALICRAAAVSVQESFHNQWFPDVKVAIEVEKAESDTKIGFCYVSKYLFFIVEELLKNAAQAVVNNSLSAEELGRNVIKITVCADEKNVAINICDKGGGIRSEHMDRIWSYAYSTNEEPTEAQALHSKGSPVCGWGLGLPLSRLYVRYLGGSLDIMNMPGIGVDTYLFLNRLEIQKKPV